MGPRRYTLDGRPVDLGELLLVNPDILDDQDLVAEIRALLPGDSLTIGGGAAHAFVLARLDDVERCQRCFTHVEEPDSEEHLDHCETPEESIDRIEGRGW